MLVDTSVSRNIGEKKHTRRHPQNQTRSICERKSWPIANRRAIEGTYNRFTPALTLFDALEGEDGIAKWRSMWWGSKVKCATKSDRPPDIFFGIDTWA